MKRKNINKSFKEDIEDFADIAEDDDIPITEKKARKGKFLK